MTKAKDIMTTGIVTIRADTPSLEVIDILLENKVSGLPVVDEEMNLLGLVTEKDLLHLLVSEGIGQKDSIQALMSKDVIEFDEEEDIVTICKCLIENPFRRVPIVKDGKLVGVVSRRDILKSRKKKTYIS